MRVFRPYPNGLAERADETKQKLIETLRRRRCGASRNEEARERRPGEILVKASDEHPGREKPKGATSGRRPKPTLGRQGLAGWVKAQKSQLIEPAPESSDARVYRWVNDMWVLPSRKRPVTICEEKAPKGESHERCRYETRLARPRRE